MEHWYLQQINLGWVTALGLFLLSYGGAMLCLGYWMGRNSAEKPSRAVPRVKASKGPQDEPEGDVFREAMQGPPAGLTKAEREKRISTGVDW